MNRDVFCARRTPGFMTEPATFQGSIDLTLAIGAIKACAEAPEIGWNFDSDSKHIRFLSGKR
jgi:hypothetical protein